VWAENAPDAGARFTVLLPLSDEAVNAVPPPDRLESLQRPQARIMVVEYEEQVREVVSPAFSDGLMRDHQPFLQKPVADDLLARTLEEVLEVRAVR
jgi:hypothetical protein